MKRQSILISVAAVFAAMLIGCSNQAADNRPAEQAEAPNAGSTSAVQEDQALIIAGQEIAASLDPVKPLTSAYLRNMGAAEALFKVNEAGEVEPSLAESAREVDSTTWVIGLREGATFWSGSPVNADAVIASLERSRAEDPQAQPYLAELAFSKLDDRSIEVKTLSEHVAVPLQLSYYQTVIHNADARHESVETMDLTGMYKVVSFAPKQSMALAINERYWGTKPTIPRIVHEQIADGQTRVLSVLSGRSHIALNIPVTSLQQFKDGGEAALVAAPVANTQTVYLNLRQPQLADAGVRQALSWALDREELVLLGAEGQSEPVATWLGSNPLYPEAKQAVYGKPDPDRAMKLLDEAGWLLGDDGVRYKDGKPLTLRLQTWGGDQALGEALQNQWTRIGIKAEVKHGDYSLIETARQQGDWDASIEAWSTFGDAYSLLAGQFSPEGSANYGGYDDEETNRLLAELKQAADDDARRKLALEINERAAVLAPVIALYPRPQLTAVSNKLAGFEEHFRQFENVVNANLTFDSAGSE